MTENTTTAAQEAEPAVLAARIKACAAHWAHMERIDHTDQSALEQVRHDMLVDALATAVRPQADAGAVPAVPAVPEGWRLMPVDPPLELLSIFAGDERYYPTADCEVVDRPAMRVMAQCASVAAAHAHAARLNHEYLRDHYLARWHDLLDAVPAAPKVASSAAAGAVLSLVLADIDTCIGEAGLGYEFRELSTETIAAIEAYRAAAPQAPAAAVAPAGLFEFLRGELSSIDCRYRGDPSYDHDAYWMRERVEKLFDEAERIFSSAAAVAPAEADTVDVVGVRANGEHVNLGKMTMPARMKAREIAVSQFGGFVDGDGSDGEMCFGAMEELLDWMERQRPAAAPTQEANGWMPIETAPDGERVLLGPRHAPVVGTVHRPAGWEEEQEPTATVVHYNGNVLVAGYRCSEWHRLPTPPAARARQKGSEAA